MADKGRPGGKVVTDQKRASDQLVGQEQGDAEAANIRPRQAGAGVLQNDDATTRGEVVDTGGSPHARETVITESRPEENLLSGHYSSPGDGEAVVPQLPSVAAADVEMAVLHAFTVSERQPTRTPPVIAQAVMVDSNDQRRSDRRRMASLGILSLLVLVVLVVTLTTRGGGNNTTNQSGGEAATAPSPTPIDLSSPPTTERFSDICQEILTHFESPTLEQALMNPESPQYRAALWMAEDDEHPTTASLSYPLNQTDLELLQFRQRYALVTFYYSTSTGDTKWKDQCNFLTPSLHVCHWRCSWNSTNNTIVADYFGLVWTATDDMGVSCGRQLNQTNPMLDDFVVSLEIGESTRWNTMHETIRELILTKLSSCAA
jgi:hypothetical protein